MLRKEIWPYGLPGVGILDQFDRPAKLGELTRAFATLVEMGVEFGLTLGAEPVVNGFGQQGACFLAVHGPVLTRS
ncbi:MAG TPA: hypothetical protein VNE39_01650 [Planctomycetota bacterium]|nr:hypothetical protein [Planctomycetota bacterium]